MLSQLKGSYERVDRSLQRLTDSIAAYNPSTTAAEELVAADDALSDDLETLVQHQRNVLRIQELKRIAQEHDDRIRSHFSAVAVLRKELTAIPSTNTSSTTRNVDVDELLSYARYISATTVPPTFRRKDLPSLAPKPTDAPQLTNGGIATPVTATQDGDATADPGNPPYLPASSLATDSLTEPDKAYLNPVADLPFAPWPEHFVIAGGALGEIQRMVEQGKDPASVLSPAEQVEADIRKREEDERDRVLEEERERRRRMIFDEAGMSRRAAQESEVFDPDA